MKNQLKVPGDTYEIDNEIPQAIRMKWTMKFHRQLMKNIMKMTKYPYEISNEIPWGI